MLKWIIVLPALLVAGWMAFDGLRALTVGDYITPASGAYKGQLGPWAGLVSRLGLDPRGTPMKLVIAGLGLVWFAAALCFAADLRWTAWCLVACSVAALWYLPFGTVIGLTETVLLFIWLRAK